MKLMFCAKCQDIFKLVIYERRACRCKTVQGQLRDGSNAVTNGQGLAVALNNESLAMAINRFNSLPHDKDDTFYKNQCFYTGWIRPHDGPGNPRTKIEADGDLPLNNTVDILHQAVKDFHLKNPGAQSVPQWLIDAEGILKSIGVTR